MTEVKVRGMHGHEPRNACSFHELEKSRKWFLPDSLQKEDALLACFRLLMSRTKRYQVSVI